MKTILPYVIAGTVIWIAGAGLAQDAPADEPETVWTVFVEEDPMECWVVSTPTETVNTRGGDVVAVNRDEILMFVSYWPEQNRSGEVSFTGGYTFEPGSTVTVQIGEESFELFTEGEIAWAASVAEDGDIVTAMRAGSDAVLTALSNRGTTTQDTFSLLGFSAAIEDAETRCSG
ncbi:MAG: invasion associated locus B family protein [Pseudomonadota bacterium]